MEVMPYIGAPKAEVNAPPEVMKQAEQTKCEVCELELLAMTKTLNQTRQLAKRVGHRFVVVCPECGEKELGKQLADKKDVMIYAPPAAKGSR